MVEPTDTHLMPSLDTDAVTVDPDRDSCNHGCPEALPPARNVVAPPCADRVMNSRPPFGLTSSSTCGEAALPDWRSMMPAFANGDVTCSRSTRATIEPSPATGSDPKPTES